MIDKMLTISTANIDLKTDSWLRSQVNRGRNNADIVIYPKDQYGYFVPITDQVFDDEQLPAPFVDAIAHAAEKDCTWLMIDQDYPAVKELRKYEW